MIGRMAGLSQVQSARTEVRIRDLEDETNGNKERQEREQEMKRVPILLAIALKFEKLGSMLTLSGITKAHGERVLFADATLQVNRDDRIGLVGPNGAGKTTLFSIILGNESADEGKISSERGTTIGYL